MTYTDADSEELKTIAIEAGGSFADRFIAIANYVERKTLDRAASGETTNGILAELAHQVSRIADSSQRPTPTITAEQAIGAWPLRINTEKAIPYLESLGIEIEQEPTRRIS